MKTKSLAHFRKDPYYSFREINKKKKMAISTTDIGNVKEIR